MQNLQCPFSLQKTILRGLILFEGDAYQKPDQGDPEGQGDQQAGNGETSEEPQAYRFPV
jgi:hypothetical protein